MKRLLIFSTCVAVVFCYNDGLRVKHGKGSEEVIKKEFFLNIPRTLSEVVTQGWRETVRPRGPLPHLKLYCPPDRELCVLYHPTSGFVAGLQVALPVNEIRAEPKVLKQFFTKWSPPATGEAPARKYLTVTQYYVPEGPNEAVPTLENNQTLQYDGVWVRGYDGHLVRIPTKETELRSNFTKQCCIPMMGTHYYYNLSKDMICENIFPWFSLVKDGQLIGLGFMLYGHLNKPLDQSSQQDWFEKAIENKPQYLKLLQTLWPDAPSCLPQLVSKYKLTQMHIYFIDEPWKVKCSPSDSVKPKRS